MYNKRKGKLTLGKLKEQLRLLSSLRALLKLSGNKRDESLSSVGT